MAPRRAIVWWMTVGSLLMMGGQRTASAAEWLIEPSMSVRGEYHSNLLLALEPQLSTYAYWISPAVRLAGSTETLQVGSKLAFDYVEYQGERDAKIYNLHFPLSVQYRQNRSIWGFTGGLNRDNTLRSELLETGVVLAFAQRNFWSAAPSWTYSVTERLSAQTSYQYNKADYEKGSERLFLFDYEVHSASETLSYTVTDKDSIQVTGLFTRFALPARGNLVADTYGVQMGGTHMFSEDLTLSASGGPRFITNRIDTRIGTLEDTTTVWVFNARLAKKWERANWSVEIGRDIFPSGFGLLIQKDHLLARASYEVTDHLTFSLNGQASIINPVATNELFTGGVRFRETRFFHIDPHLRWRFAEYWAMDVGYMYSRRELEGVDRTGESHAVRLLVTYAPLKFSISR
ncbi:MAG: hypothetical protein NNA20_07040 [Nitrospira sp.]|nr:hypothetical protein [Nitrospira sp.]MCP9442333.1 hypothetical protein [Nitrospira sp.]